MEITLAEAEKYLVHEWHFSSTPRFARIIQAYEHDEVVVLSDEDAAVRAMHDNRVLRAFHFRAFVQELQWSRT